MKSVPELIKCLTAIFNEYIRVRDAGQPCISCGQYKELQAGHYLSAGHHAVWRFNEWNVNGQCVRCNMHLHGNLIGYRKGLVRKIGEERVLMLESSRHGVKKWDRFELELLISEYKKKLKHAKQ
jgi:hypothetical protein